MFSLSVPWYLPIIFFLSALSRVVTMFCPGFEVPNRIVLWRRPMVRWRLFPHGFLGYGLIRKSHGAVEKWKSLYIRINSLLNVPAVRFEMLEVDPLAYTHSTRPDFMPNAIQNVLRISQLKSHIARRKQRLTRAATLSFVDVKLTN